MMGKLIIHNETSFGDDEVLGLVSEIIAEGRISNGGYCYVTVYREMGVVVGAKKNQHSDTFYIRHLENN
jgi:hypothetical protein